MSRLFEKPLLRLDANGYRYFIARRPGTTELCFGSASQDGVGYGLLGEGEGEAASAAPWDEWVVAGRLPRGARTVEIVADGRPYRSKTRSGLWMAAVACGQDVLGEAKFLDAAGQVVEIRDLHLGGIPRRRAVRK